MKYKVRDPVAKLRGDYTFKGWVVAAFKKRSGAERYVVENEDGILHIFSEKNIELCSKLREPT